jgi:hypothetical protein
MKGILFVVFVFFIFSTTTFADERCGTGKVFSRDTINCIQETCPTGTGRNYGGVCQCYNSDWGENQEKRTDCRDSDGLLTHCVKEGEKCENTSATQNSDVPASGEPIQDTRPSFFRSMLNFLQAIGLFRTSDYDANRQNDYVVTSVFGKVSGYISNLFN